MQKFKVGDEVRIIKNSYDGQWEPGYAGKLKVIDPAYGKDVDVEGVNARGEKLCQIYRDTDLELIVQVHPNQKLADEVAEILRNTADFYLIKPNGKYPTYSSNNPSGCGSSYSCCAMQYCAMDKKWSDSKIKRVIERFLRSLGVVTESMSQLPGNWNTRQRQETRHAWLYIAAQFAEENPDLVPTYGKKKVSA